MIDIISNIDWLMVYSALSTIVGGILGTLFKKEKTDNKTLVNLSSDTTPQDAKQTAALDKIDKDSWTMSQTTLNTLFDMMRKTGATVTLDALEQTIRRAENDKRVDYGLIVFDGDGNAATEPTSAFISRGKIDSLGTYAQIDLICDTRGTIKYAIAA